MKLFERETDPIYEIFESGKNLRKRKRPVPPSIESLISRKEKKKFVKNLFENNAVRYDEFIQVLNTLKNWSSSFQKMEDEFVRQKRTMREREVIAFTDIVFRRFYPD
ncbi:MAG: hypothetical protein JSW33_08835 [bacterium]|nr:MAG: hypothetical protein JSW33_08835 [bacterium]